MRTDGPTQPSADRLAAGQSPGGAGLPAAFPTARPRRLRRTPGLREVVRETSLEPADLVAPLFVKEGISEPQEVPSLPGVRQHTLDSLVAEAEDLRALGVRTLLLFGVPAHKDPEGSEAWNPDGVLQQGLAALRQTHGEAFVLAADTCLDEYTDHGHCGPIDPGGHVDNDAANAGYARAAVSQAEAGADVVAPSGMMDGQVAAIRAALDAAGHAEDTAIMSYCSKYASALYGPFRDVAESTPTTGDRRGHQLDPANAEEGVREALTDVAEGADILLVKPATAYLDLVHRVKAATGLPLAAYHVSGEYAMLQAAAQKGWIDGDAVAGEIALSIRRAGADLVITYAAAAIARRLQ